MAKRTSRKALQEVQAKSFECARCGKVHNGSSVPPGWGHEPGQGLICDDCEDQLALQRRTGLEKRHAA